MSTTLNTNARWLRCKVEKGMFSDEVAVTYPANGAAVTSVFVPRTAVQGTPGGEGWVQVLLANTGNGRVVTLPTEYQDRIPVSESDLSDMP